jgi:hypothetical protein
MLIVVKFVLSTAILWMPLLLAGCGACEEAGMRADADDGGQEADDGDDGENADDGGDRLSSPWLGFPRFEMPARLYTVNIDEAASGLRMTQQLSMFVLQGVVNARSAGGGTQIWISSFDDYSVESWWCALEPVVRRAEQAAWLDYYRDTYGIQDEIKTPPELLDWARDEGYTASYIIYDPGAAWTRNIGATMAGISGSILIHPDDESGGLDLAGRGYSLYADLRNGYDGRWEVTGDPARDRVNAYTWAVTSLMPQADTRTIQSLLGGDYHKDNPDLFDCLACLTDPTRCHRFFPSAFDYAVASRAFVWLLDFSALESSPELDLARDILSFYEPPRPAMGWAVSELDFISLVSSYGHYFLGPAGSGWYANLSVHASIHDDLDFSSLMEAPVEPEDVVVDTGAVYVTIIAHSDGMMFQLMHGKADPDLSGTLEERGLAWLHPARGMQPLGWIVFPEVADLAPGVMRYYMETATENDSLVFCGPMGYVYPGVMSGLAVTGGLWERLLEKSLPFLAELGISRIGAIFMTTEEKGGLGAIAHDLGPTVNPLRAIIAGSAVGNPWELLGEDPVLVSVYGVGDAHLTFVGGKPVFHFGVYSGWGAGQRGSIGGQGSQSEPGATNVVAAIEDYADRRALQRPLFVTVLLQNWSNAISEANEAAQLLSGMPGFEVVPLGRMVALSERAWREGMLRLELMPRSADGGNNIFDFLYLQSDGSGGGFSTAAPLQDWITATDIGGDGTPANPYYRRAEGADYWYYQINTEGCAGASVETDIAGSYEIHVSADPSDWGAVALASPTGNESRRTATFDLDPYLPREHVYIRFAPNRLLGGEVRLYNLILHYNDKGGP